MQCGRFPCLPAGRKEKPGNQIVFIESTLDERIDEINPVRIIDAFVTSCNLEELGFTHAKHDPEGRPPYHPSTLLKLFIYGYLNRIRSSRMLERESKRNVELMWLLEKLTPDHNTIISQCHEMGVETMVAVPALSTQAPDPAYNVDQFIYHKETDSYQCPQGNILHTYGSWYNKGYDHRIKQYKTPACDDCPARDLCTKARHGRVIERNEFAEAVQRNKHAIEKNTHLYCLFIYPNDEYPGY